MKKTVILLLTLALLAVCLAGCANKDEIQFGADCLRFANEAPDVTSDMDTFAGSIAECLEADGVTIPLKNDWTYYGKCVQHHELNVQQWALDGEDVTGLTQEEITSRLPGIIEQYEAISGNKIDAENAVALRAAVIRLYQAEQDMIYHVTNVAGPADSYRDRALTILDKAVQARKEILELLEPYWQKKGFPNLANKIINGG